jgi:WD40 repeat protein
MTGQEQITLASHSTWVNDVILSNDKKFLAARDDDCGVRLWNIPEGKQIAAFPRAEHSYERSSMVFSADSELLAVEMRYGKVQLFRSRTGEEFSTISGSLATCAFAPSGKAIAFAEPSGQTLSSLKLWDLTPGHAPRKCNAHGNIERIAFAPDGRTIAAFVSTGTGLLELKVWKADSLDEAGVLAVDIQSGDRLYFSPDSRFLVAIDNSDGVTTMVWDLRAQPARGAFEFRYVLPEFTRDGALMAASNWWTGRADLWNTTTFQKVASVQWSDRSLDRDELVVQSMKLTPDGKFFAMAALDNTESRGTAAVVYEIAERIGLIPENPWVTRLWDTTTGKELLRFNRDSVLSPDGRTLLTQFAEVKLWEMPPQWPIEFILTLLLSATLFTICLGALWPRKSTVAFPR